MHNPHRGGQSDPPPPTAGTAGGKHSVSATSGAEGRCVRGGRPRPLRLPPDGCSKSWPARHAWLRFECSGVHNRGERGVLCRRGGGEVAGLPPRRRAADGLVPWGRGGAAAGPLGRVPRIGNVFFLAGFQMTINLNGPGGEDPTCTPWTSRHVDMRGEEPARRAQNCEQTEPLQYWSLSVARPADLASRRVAPCP